MSSIKFVFIQLSATHKPLVNIFLATSSDYKIRPLQKNREIETLYMIRI